jgi:hypothetical protein
MLTPIIHGLLLTEKITAYNILLFNNLSKGINPAFLMKIHLRPACQSLILRVAGTNFCDGGSAIKDNDFAARKGTIDFMITYAKIVLG